MKCFSKKRPTYVFQTGLRKEKLNNFQFHKQLSSEKPLKLRLNQTFFHPSSTLRMLKENSENVDRIKKHLIMNVGKIVKMLKELKGVDHVCWKNSKNVEMN